MTPDLIDELIDNFGYTNLIANEIIHRAAEEIVNLRSRVQELEEEVNRLKKTVL